MKMLAKVQPLGVGMMERSHWHRPLEDSPNSLDPNMVQHSIVDLSQVQVGLVKRASLEGQSMPSNVLEHACRLSHNSGRCVES